MLQIQMSATRTIVCPAFVTDDFGNSLQTIFDERDVGIVSDECEPCVVERGAWWLIASFGAREFE